MMKVVRMMVIIPHVMVEEPHKMAKALHILTEAPIEKTSHHIRQFWLSIIISHKVNILIFFIYACRQNNLRYFMTHRNW